MITGSTQHANWPCTVPDKHLLSLQRLAVKWLHYLAFIPCSVSLPTSSPFCKQQIFLGSSPNLWPFLGQAHADSSARISSSLPSPAPWLCVNTQQKWHLQEILPISVSPCFSHPHLLCFSASLCLLHSAHLCHYTFHTGAQWVSYRLHSAEHCSNTELVLESLMNSSAWPPLVSQVEIGVICQPTLAALHLPTLLPNLLPKFFHHQMFRSMIGTIIQIC